MKVEKSNAPNGWRTVKLGEICELNPRRSEIIRTDDAPTTFLPMPAIGEAGAGIMKPEIRRYAEVRRGYTFFAEGDVLFAKITPCMQNGKHAIARNLLDGVGFGSTEFHVLRPGSEILSEWILHFLLQPKVSAEAERHFTGAVGQQRVPESVLASMEIPLPPVNEQRRIAARLREQMVKVESARAAVEHQLDAAQKLPAALLRAVFTSPAAQRWPRRKLGEVIQPRNDIIHPRNKPTGKATFVGLEHIEPSTGRRIGSVEIDKAEMTGRKAQFFKDDIVYGYLRPYLNKVWIAEFDGLCSVDQYVYQVNDDIAVTPFVAWFMRSSAYLERAPIGQTPGQLPRIRMDEVAATEINLPSLYEQHAIAALLDSELTAARSLGESLSTRLAEIKRLPAALLREAFSNENPKTN